eukprot:6213847-Pleurochrysis_carterae.AAC.1
MPARARLCGSCAALRIGNADRTREVQSVGVSTSCVTLRIWRVRGIYNTEARRCNHATQGACARARNEARRL